jgi:L-cysteine desulfidase
MIPFYLFPNDFSVTLYIIQLLLSHGSATVSELVNNPLSALYVLQGVTYGVASAISWHERDCGLTICYAVSSFVHGLFGVCHYFHIG